VTAVEAPLRRARRATSVAFAAQGLLLAVLLTRLPAFKVRLGIGDGTVTLVILGVIVLAGAGSVLANATSRRWGSAATLRAALLVEVAAVAVIGVAAQLPLFCAAFAVYGTALGVVDATSNMQAVAVEHRYGRSVLTSFHAVWSAAGIAGALWTALGERLSWSVGLCAGAAAGVVAVATLATAPSYLRSDALVPAHGAPVEHAAPDALLARGAGRAVLLIGVAMACFYVVDSGVANWSTVYLHDALGADDGTAALGFAGYQATSLLARLVGDRAVGRWGAAQVVRLGAVLGLVGAVTAVVAPGAWAAVAGFTLVGLGLPVVAPLAFAAAGRLAPGAADAFIAKVNIFNYVGALGGGVLVGGVGTAFGLRIGFVVPLVVTVGVLVLAPVFGASS
jgi:hypothetical protein